MVVVIKVLLLLLLLFFVLFFFFHFFQAFDHLDLTLNDSYVSLEKLLDKMDWTAFPGVQKLLLKGLTHDTTSEPTRELLSRY